MKIRFLGPLGKVTGSCTWMRDESRGWNFLVDCGIQQGERTAAEWNECNWPFDPAAIKFVVLTHAHMDHCGLLPMLYKKGFTGTVYCSRETSEIAQILLKDAAKLAEVGYAEQDVDLIKWHEPIKEPFLGSPHPVDTDLFLRFYRAGHVLGATSVAIYWGQPGPDQRSIVFSGDLGPGSEDHEVMPFLRHRMNVKGCDFAVVESTYGAVIRSNEECDPEQRRARLRQLIDQTIEHRSALLIPAFSFGRTQDVLFDLNWIVAENPEKYGAVSYYMDAPTAKKINSVYLNGIKRTENNGKNGKVRPLWLGKQMFRWLGLDNGDPVHVQRLMDICRMTFGHAPKGDEETRMVGNALAQSWRCIVRQVKRRESISPSENAPLVIIASSGTCNGGPVAYWLPKFLASEANTVALTGYCSPGTVGGKLLSLSTCPIKERQKHTGSINVTEVDVIAIAEIRANILKLAGYSAHDDQNGLLDWIFGSYQGQTNLAGKTIFLQHGADGQRRALSAAIEIRAGELNVEVPVIEPDNPDVWHDLTNDGKEIENLERKRFLELEIERLSRELGGMAA